MSFAVPCSVMRAGFEPELQWQCVASACSQLHQRIKPQPPVRPRRVYFTLFKYVINSGISARVQMNMIESS